MRAPRQYVPLEQSIAFNRAIAERLGLDPAIISGNDFRADIEVMGGEELGKVSVSFTAYLPADELVEMFNTAGRP
jgi:hypothetical protein